MKVFNNTNIPNTNSTLIDFNTDQKQLQSNNGTLGGDYVSLDSRNNGNYGMDLALN